MKCNTQTKIGNWNKAQKSGFTLIELLVVTVIIGILSTITAATFSSAFSRSRDSERQQAVNTMSRVLSTALAQEGISEIPTTSTAVLDALLNQGQYPVPAVSTAGFNYFYYTDGVRHFAFYTCTETDETLIVSGTSNALTTLQDSTNDPTCSGTGVTPGTDGTTLNLST